MVLDDNKEPMEETTAQSEQEVNGNDRIDETEAVSAAEPVEEPAVEAPKEAAADEPAKEHAEDMVSSELVEELPPPEWKPIPLSKKESKQQKKEAKKQAKIDAKNEKEAAKQAASDAKAAAKQEKAAAKQAKRGGGVNKKFVAGVVIAFLVLGGALYPLSLTQMGYAVVFRNQTIGYVQARDELNRDISAICDDIIQFAPEEQKDTVVSVDYQPALIWQSTFSQTSDITDQIKEAVGIYADGVIVCVNGEEKFNMASQEQVAQMLEQYKQENCGEGGEVVSIELKNEVTAKPGKQLPITTLLSIEDAIDTLSGLRAEGGTHVVQEGETLWQYSIENDISVEDLMDLNNLDDDVIEVGQELRVKLPVPLCTVVVTKNITYTEYEESETVYEYDNTLAKGTYRTRQQGQRGEKNISATVTLENLHEIDRQITAEEVVSEMKKTIIRVGTMPQAATGRLMRPVRGGYISSAFGTRRSGYHTGLDIAVPMRTQVMAADGGTVTASGWGGGYGYYVKISHGNGLETLYAHNSTLVVKKGQKVSKGQLIAYSGSTGNSTGPHVHFEVRKNGAFQNPLNYIPAN